MSPQIAEYIRPWKLATLGAGLALLLCGSLYYQVPTWDKPISFSMALLAYLTAPFSVRVVVQRRWKLLPLMVLFVWFSVDGCYSLYWSLRNPEALEIMRAANASASMALYLLCGILWLYNGSLAELARAVRSSIDLSNASNK